uniref:Uncharacterized protein n=1 Tax=Hyaloperonospora arabidopsidis (strain Emoy2) TaxID=559515 RepID=M4C3X3_HYAAE
MRNSDEDKAKTRIPKIQQAQESTRSARIRGDKRITCRLTEGSSALSDSWAKIADEDRQKANSLAVEGECCKLSCHSGHSFPGQLPSCQMW